MSFLKQLAIHIAGEPDSFPYSVGMTLITFLTGLALFALGAFCRWLVQLQQWQALLPLVFGLTFLTLAEGMRSKPSLRRLFLVLAIIWSVFILAMSFPFIKHIVQAWNLQPVMMEEGQVRGELVLEQTSVFVITAVYLLIAVVQLFRQPPATPRSPLVAPSSAR